MRPMKPAPAAGLCQCEPYACPDKKPAGQQTAPSRCNRNPGETDGLPVPSPDSQVNEVGSPRSKLFRPYLLFVLRQYCSKTKPNSMPPRCAKLATPGDRPLTPRYSSSKP